MLRAQELIPKVLFLVAVALVCAVPAFAAETAESPAVAQVTVAPALPAAGCELNLASLPGQSTQGETCTVKAPEAQVPEFMASHRLGYCHCGCVAQRVCRTSADCGGASCDQFISCC
jgi:hypothetical protein